MTTIHPQIDGSWEKVLKKEFESPYFKKLKQFLEHEKKQYRVFPPGPLIFEAFNRCSFDSCRIVLLGQDPYHGERQANGLSFSVASGIRPPPSLQNIFKEMKNDMGIPIPISGDLGRWADQGILLLNATLTVRENLPGSHQNQGWERFTDTVIRELSARKEGLIFLLWGKFAQSKESLINQQKHFVLKAAHPSPLARGAFFGSKPFSQANQILKEQGLDQIDWRLDLSLG
jgi:uracil-DNA glycosylase